MKPENHTSDVYYLLRQFMHRSEKEMVGWRGELSCARFRRSSEDVLHAIVKRRVKEAA